MGIAKPKDDGGDDKGCIDAAVKFGSSIIKPAVDLIFVKKEDLETTTPYAYANYAYSPGYYKDSLVTCSQDALIGETISLTCLRENTKIACNDTLFAKDIVKINCKTIVKFFLCILTNIA